MVTKPENRREERKSEKRPATRTPAEDKSAEERRKEQVVTSSSEIHKHNIFSASLHL